MRLTSYGKKRLSITILIVLIFCLAFGSYKRQTAGHITKTGFYFDTVITLTLYDDKCQHLLDDCFALAEKYENLFSATIPSSEISQINQAGGMPVTVSDETIALLNKGLEYCSMSNGGFDITIGKLSSLWDFSEHNDSLPDPAAIADAVSTIGYQNIIISGNEVRLNNPNAAIDLGAIAKGYIADQMKAYLNQNGVTEGAINLGGNVLCIGPKSNGSAYRIGIQMPFAPQGLAAAVVEVPDDTVVSSGVYERYITVDDQIYHHILNPATGYPYENDLLGVSILCQNSVDGDGLSTTCFSLGLTDGMELIESLADTEAVFITQDYEFHCSSGIGDKIPFKIQDMP